MERNPMCLLGRWNVCRLQCFTVIYVLVLRKFYCVVRSASGNSTIPIFPSAVRSNVGA